jgi:hypothetical protein
MEWPGYPLLGCILSGMGNPWVPVTRSGMGMGVHLYLSVGMGFWTGINFLRGHGYESIVPSRYVPVAILIHSFLGHARFYKRFIKDFSQISRPLTNLLAKDAPFEFIDECLNAFYTLKKALISAPII